MAQTAVGVTLRDVDLGDVRLRVKDAEHRAREWLDKLAGSWGRSSNWTLPYHLLEAGEKAELETELAKWGQLLQLPRTPTVKQLAVLTAPERGMDQPLLLGGGMGGSKGQPYNDPVITPFGEKKMGDIRVGDQVSNPDGSIARVLQVVELGVRAIYKVSFSDGSFMNATEDHIWLGWEAMKEYKAKRRWYTMDGPGEDIGKGRLYDTMQVKEITEKAAARREARGGGKGGSFLIPVSAPTVFTRSNSNPTKLPPYALGVLLGDGSFSEAGGVSFAKPDVEIATRVSELLGGIELPMSKNTEKCPVYRIPAATGVKDDLRRLELLGKRSWEKFIPEQYKYRNVESRWELLRGLMDTDGTVSADKGHLSFSSSSERLADDVRWLIESLGGVATKTSSPSHYTINGVRHEARDAYKLYIKFRDGKMAFSLPRKRDKVKPQQGLYRRVVSVERVEDEKARCIKVDHPNGLYLGNDFIVTHNTATLVMGAIKAARTVPNNRVLLGRATFVSMRTSTILELEEQLAFCPDAIHQKGYHRVWFPKSNSYVWYMGVGGPAERQRIRSTEFGWIGLDEVTEIAEIIANEVSMRLRWGPASELGELQQLYTCNPEPGWVKEQFISNPKPGYRFIQALPMDNPFLNGGDYLGYIKSAKLRQPKEWFDAYILGNWDAFVPTDAAIPEPLLRALRNRAEEPDDYDTVWGVDIARGGADWTTVWRRRGSVFDCVGRWRHRRTTGTTDALLNLFATSSPKPWRINIDDGGVGGGVSDQMVKASGRGKLGRTVVGQVVAGSRPDTDDSAGVNFYNKRAEMVGLMRRLLESGLGSFAPSLPVDLATQVIGDLSTPRAYQASRRGRPVFAVEGKPEVKSRLGRSPDDGDAILLTLHEGQRDYVGGTVYEGTGPEDEYQASLAEHYRLQRLAEFEENWRGGFA